MSKSKKTGSKKERLMLEYKRNRRNRIVGIVVGVLVAAAVIAAIVFGVDWENFGGGESHIHSEGCAH
jgi:hypothetical protein